MDNVVEQKFEQFGKEYAALEFNGASEENLNRFWLHCLEDYSEFQQKTLERYFEFGIEDFHIELSKHSYLFSDPLPQVWIGFINDQLTSFSPKKLFAVNRPSWDQLGWMAEYL